MGITKVGLSHRPRVSPVDGKARDRETADEGLQPDTLYPYKSRDSVKPIPLPT